VARPYYAVKYQLICQGRTLGNHFSPPVVPGVKLKILSRSEGVYYEFGKSSLRCNRETLVSECYSSKVMPKYYIRDNTRDVYGNESDDCSFYRAYQAEYRTEKYKR
jgi:hypothetical protein